MLSAVVFVVVVVVVVVGGGGGEVFTVYCSVSVNSVKLQRKLKQDLMFYNTVFKFLN